MDGSGRMTILLRTAFASLTVRELPCSANASGVGVIIAIVPASRSTV